MGAAPSALAPPTEVISIVKAAAVVGAVVRGVGVVEAGVPDGDGDGGGSAGGWGDAAVVSPSITLGIAASPRPFVPAAPPNPFLPPGLGPSD